MIEYNGEAYLTANEIAQRFNISWGTCRSNILTQVNACSLPGRKRVLYRLSDVEQLSEVRIVEKVSCRALPALPAKTRTGSECTRTPSHCNVQWTGEAILAECVASHNRKDR